MRLVVISDTHNKHNQVKLPPGDVLIHCGDFSACGRHKEVLKFLTWFRKQPHKEKIYIAGNHDLSYEREPEFKNEILKEFGEIHYLENSGITLNNPKTDEPVEFWGSPWQPEFGNWAFNYKREGEFCKKLWDSVPSTTDILITHSPMKDILDKCERSWEDAKNPINAGCKILRNKIETDLRNLKFHLCGHIHEARGCNSHTLAPTICINASICNLKYQPINKPIVIDFAKRLIEDF